VSFLLRDNKNDLCLRVEFIYLSVICLFKKYIEIKVIFSILDRQYFGGVVVRKFYQNLFVLNNLF
jgi:hypothetical protein